MKNKKQKTTAAFLCLLLTFLMIAGTVGEGLYSNVEPQQPTTILKIDPTPVTVHVCERFTVAVNVKDVTDLWAWEFKLRFNPALLECLSVTEGPFLQLSGPTIWIPPIIDNTLGTIHAGCARIGPPPGASGSGIIAYIEFHCKGPGECDLVFLYPETYLMNSFGNTIPHVAINGHVIQILSTTLYIDPTPVTAFVCDRFTVAVNIREVTDLYMWQLNLSFNPNLLECLNVTEGPFLKSVGPTIFGASIDNTAGTVISWCMLLMPQNGASGSGTLAYIEFHCKGSGECDLTFLYPETLLLNSIQEQILHNTVNGHVVQLYGKPGYPDYAPNGVPDFDQKQDKWGKLDDLGMWRWTYCGPVAVANSLWWLDSANEPVPIPPPAINDHFPLVQTYASMPPFWDDHDPLNVQPFVQDLAWLMDTDGQRTAPCTSMGTNVIDMQRGIDAYLEMKGLGDKFYEKTVKMPTFEYIEWEVEKCEDVILLLGFWQWNGAEWVRVGGHYVTVAGVDSPTFKIAFSDPFVDNAELGGQGRVRPPHAPHPSDPLLHNNASYVSHDMYNVILAPEFPSPGNPNLEILYEPYYLPDLMYNCQGQNVPDEFEGQTGEYNPSLQIRTEVEYAVIVSPWFKKPAYPDYAPSEVPDFCQQQDVTWGQLAPLYLHTLGLIDLTNPLYTPWHELYPTYCREYYLTSWKHHATLSPSDIIDMTDDSGRVEWFHVDEVTVDVALKDRDTGIIHYMEFTDGLYLFDRMRPLDTWWHELYPGFSSIWQLTSWSDNGNCLLDYCDQIGMIDEIGIVHWFHVEEVTVTIQVTSYNTGITHYFEFRDGIDKFNPAIPIGTYWHEVYPEFCKIWQLTSWEDSYMLSPSDQIDMMDITERVQWYHVDQITVTLTVTTLVEPITTMYIDFEGYIGQLNFMNPVFTQWHEIYPNFCKRYRLIGWVDNGNGRLDPSDIIILQKKITGEIIDCHVDAVATDLVVTPKVRWTWCGPVAVANSLWWLDSAKERNTIPPPAVHDNYPLVQSYLGGIDDHDPRNVQPLVRDLATYMDTDGIKTGLQHFGTNVFDMQAGIAHYLSKTGLNPEGDANGDGVVDDTDAAIVQAAFGSHPGDSNWNLAADLDGDNFVGINDAMIVARNYGRVGKFYEKTVWGRSLTLDLIERELYMCEDVVLLLGFWQYDTVTQQWTRFGGHYVTVVGVDSKDFYMAISDPFRNNAEDGGMGRVLPLDHPYPHCCLVHNNATFVSHDLYAVGLSPSPGGTWGLLDYVIPEPYIENFVGQNFPAYELSPYLQGQPVYTEIEYAVIVSCKGGIVAAGSEDGNVYTFDFSGNLLWTYQTGASVESVAMSERGEYVVAGSFGNGLFVFDTAGTLLWSRAIPISESYDGSWRGADSKTVGISADGAYIVAATSAGLYLYDNLGNLIWQWAVPTITDETCVEISPDGRYIVCCNYNNGEIHFFSHLRDGLPGWQPTDGSPIWTQMKGAYWVAIDGCGRYVAFSGDANANGRMEVNLYNRAGTQVWSWEFNRTGFVRIDMPWDSSGVVAVNDDPSDSTGTQLVYFSDMKNGVAGWQATDGTPQWIFVPTPDNPNSDLYSVSISPDGKVIATGPAQYNNIYLLSKSGLPIQTIPDGIVNALDLTFTGQYGVAGARSNTWPPTGMIYFFSKITNTILWSYPIFTEFSRIRSVAIQKKYPCLEPFPYHDVDVTNVQRYTTPDGKVKTIVCQGYPSNDITVTLSNHGDYTETVEVTLYAYSSSNNTIAFCGNKTVTIAPGATPSINITWTSTNVPYYGTYILHATIGPVQDENNLVDNEFIDQGILITGVGDIDGNRKVEIKDIAAIAKAFGSRAGQPAYHPNLDIDCNYKIEVKDIAISAKYFGKVYK